MSKITEEDYSPLPAPIPESVYEATDVAIAVSGGMASGKTTYLVNRVATLLEADTNSQDIVVLCASPDSARDFAQALGARTEGAGGVRVTTPRDLCLELLGRECVGNAVGRDARLLAPFEMDFLLEDVKVTGVNPKRLREMLKFFYKGMTQLSDWDADWLVTTEEDLVFGALKECLRFTRAVIEPELANVVARRLHDDAEVRASVGFAHVLVDDYQLLSRASQVLANLLAKESICVAYDSAFTVEAFEGYPYLEGVQEFCAVNEHAAFVELSGRYACAASVHAGRALLNACGIEIAGDAAAETAGEPVVLAAADPSQELGSIAAYVEQAISCGVAPSGICIAAPRALWARNVARALEGAGIVAEVARDAKVLSGDIRDLDASAKARAYTALCLLANPRDAVAWRSWLGFGDWLCYSMAFSELRTWGVRNGLSLDEAVARLREGDCEDACSSAASVAHFAEACDAIDRLRALADGLEGDELLGLVCDSVAPGEGKVLSALKRLTAPVGEAGQGARTAQGLVACARARLNAPRFECEGAVRIAPFERAATLRSDIVLVCGCVNGLFPSRAYFDRTMMSQDDAEKQHARDARLFAKVVGSARSELAFSRFDHVALEPAEMLRLNIRRIELREGVRTALLEESVYLGSVMERYRVELPEGEPAIAR